MITVSAPAKVNLLFQVGPLQLDGYHQVNSLYLELDLRDEVTISKGLAGSGINITVAGNNLPARHINAVPKDKTNLVYKVAEYFYSKANIELDDLDIHIQKSIPVAGGMAGGSADAAAMMLAINEFLASQHGITKLSLAELIELGAEFGADVPFSLLGGLAHGTNKGEKLESLPRLPFEPYFVLVISQEGLSTPQVFARFDELGLGSTFSALSLPNSLEELANLMENDLQQPAISLLPSIEASIEVLKKLGALAALVSGSGPTTFGLFDTYQAAESVCQVLVQEGNLALVAKASYSGTRLQN